MHRMRHRLRGADHLAYSPRRAAALDSQSEQRSNKRLYACITMLTPIVVKAYDRQVSSPFHDVEIGARQASQ